MTTYPRSDSQFLTDDMASTAEKVVEIIKAKYGFDNPFDTPMKVDVKRVLNSEKVSDHHAIIPTLELAKKTEITLTKDEGRVLCLIAVRLLEAVGSPHKYVETEVTAECMGEIFSAKGKVIKEQGWKELEEVVQDLLEARANAEIVHTMKQVTQGEKIPGAKAEKSEHYTSPPKAFSEDTLLAAMENAGNKEFDPDAERKGLGTPATRASIIEKLVYSGYAKRKGKQIQPTEDGLVLSSVLPEYLKSPVMTAEWENQLLLIERGKISQEIFMRGIEELIATILKSCSNLPESEKSRFRSVADKGSVGNCPVCGKPVFENKFGFSCSDRKCGFILWRENRYMEKMKKKIDTKMAIELLAQGRTNVRDFYSEKKGRYFTADLLAEVVDGKVQFSLEFPTPSKKSTEQKS